MSVTILLFAAGASSRMGGRDKLMELIDGRPLLSRSATRAVATGLPVIVVLPPDRPARLAVTQALGLPHVIAEEARDGMSASIRAGLGALPPDAPGALMLMADMPDLDTGDLLTLAARFADAGESEVIRAAAEDGSPGSPTLVPRRLFPALSALSGDQGGRAVLKSQPTRLVPLAGRRALTDLDTPEDWAAWRAGKE